MSNQIVLRPHKSQVLKTVSDLFPPWQGVADLASKIVDLVKGFHSAKRYWEELGTYVEGVTTDIAITLAQTNLSQASVKAKLETLFHEIERERALPRYKRAFRYLHDLERIADMKQRLNDTIKIFQLGAIASTYVAADQALSVVTRNEENLTEITQRSTFIAANLRRAADASWNPDRVCYPGTRARLVQQIIQWVDDPRVTKAALTNEEPLAHLPRGAQILLLTGVAGAGKSTVAHTIAQHYFEKGQLGSSFFFDREDHDRKKPIMLLNTIAADLANLDPLIAKQMCEALKREWGLPSAPVPRQFKDLVLKFFSNYSTSSPVILVIDGLNEGWDDGFIRALRDGAAELPDNFRIFLTSRMQPELDSFARKDRVCWLELDIGSQDNMDDVARFIPHALQQLAEDKNLGEKWPGDDLQTRFTAKAGGLFLWVTVVCDYLRTRSEPTLELEKLLSNNGLPASTAEARMGQLYKIILSSFDHNDDSFTAGYDQLMGTVLATKVPITVLGMEALLQHKPLATDFVFQKLSPLLTGLRKADHGTVPVRILHESLRDFLGSRATSLSRSLDEKEHIRGLAGTGYLSEGPKTGHGIPLLTSSPFISYGNRYKRVSPNTGNLRTSITTRSDHHETNGKKKDPWVELKNHAQSVVSSLTDSLTIADISQASTKAKLTNLKRTLQDIRELELILDLRSRLDDAIELFKLDVAATTLVQLEQTHNTVLANNQMLSQLGERHALVAAKLRRVPGASWDPDRVCLPSTRTKWIERVISWVDEPEKMKRDPTSAYVIPPTCAQILLLTGVAGAGKSTIAHSVAKICHENELLGSSFFFDRETDGRNNSSVLWNTIAADLASKDPELAQRIGALIEKDWSLPSAPISRQFTELVVQSCQGHSFDKPIVIVIDGLDEGWNDALIHALRDGVPDLPANFRIFLTSRMRPELDSLCRSEHVLWLELDIGTKDNMDDIALFIPHHLQRLAGDRNLGQDWPGKSLQKKFTAKAGGLFLWVVTVCDYLRTREDPTKELKKLLSATEPSGDTAETRMDKLYAVILNSFDWDDDGFIKSYRDLMGTVLVTKRPMSVAVMEELLCQWPLAKDFTLQSLSPLLTGMRRVDHLKTPVRPLHQSLRDFLNSRTTNEKFRVNSKERGQQLAILCIQILNSELSDSIPGTGFLSHKKGQKTILDGITEHRADISEALWYACQFWPDHVLDVYQPDVIGEGLLRFLDTKIVLWMEVISILGEYRGLKEVRVWIEDKLPHMAPLRFTKAYRNACSVLAERLIDEGRLEEAFQVMDEEDTFHPDVIHSDSEPHETSESGFQVGMPRIQQESDSSLSINDSLHFIQKAK
ncbi:hypothetical protein RhiJN_16532 [Ceratobasidium sp. AG-Ba]|nr:hypothetical protein RhiJN_16532 [Ceratobasidium sp. AG-Ba]